MLFHTLETTIKWFGRCPTFLHIPLVLASLSCPVQSDMVQKIGEVIGFLRIAAVSDEQMMFAVPLFMCASLCVHLFLYIHACLCLIELIVAERKTVHILLDLWVTNVRGLLRSFLENCMPRRTD